MTLPPPRQAPPPAQPHPRFAGVLLSPLHTGAGGLDIARVRIAVGADVPVHAHPGRADMLFILSGKGTLWIEGIGDLPMRADDFLCVPPDTPHRPHSITAPILALNIWAPATVL